jgi:RNA polymerase sigma-70 factor (ECF subfamily)
VTPQNILIDEFEAQRGRLISVAYRMLGSRSEAEDAVQEVWLRLHGTQAEGIDNIGGWLTTVVGRLWLDMLRRRSARREAPLDVFDDTAATALPARPASPEDEIELADSVGLAMLAVLEALAPAERVAFVLHDLFAVPFDDIAPIVGRSPEAARQLASRARRRVKGTRADGRADPTRRRAIIEAFISASRGGDFAALLELLDPDVVMRADEAAARLGGRPEVRGAQTVAGFFKGNAQAARPTLIDGVVDIAVVPGGRLLLVLRLTLAGDRIARIDAIADGTTLQGFDLEFLEG